MCGGSDSPDSVTQNTSNLPEYAQPYYEDLLARTGYETATPYETYPARRLQPFTQQEWEAITRFGELGTSGPSQDLQNAMYGATTLSGGIPYADNMLGATDWAQSAIADYGAYQPRYNAVDVWADYDPSTYESQYQATGGAPGAEYDPTKFAPDRLNDQALLETYMDPYQQLVTDIAKREAVRDSEQMGQEMSLAAAGQGSLGGYREAIMQSERQRNLGQNLSDIQNRGLQQAYLNAQQGVESDRESLFGAHMGYEQGLQQSAGLGLDRYRTLEGARQAEEEFRFGAWSASEAARQQAAAMGLDAQQIEEAGRQAEEQFRLSGRGMDFSGIMGMADIGQSAYSQLLGGEQARLAGLELMGGLDAQRQQMEIERLLGMQTSGQIERELMQRGLDIGYSDFLRQQAYPQEQLAFYSQILQGLPIAPGSIQQSYGMGPSTEQQLLGAGIAGVGLYNALG